MYQDHPAWVERERARWLKPDAHLWIRHDAHRFMAPGTPRLIGKDALRYFWPDVKGTQSAGPAECSRAAEHRRDLDFAAFCASHDRLKAEVAALQAEMRWHRFFRGLKAGFNPDQPRVPAGNPDGGQWTSEGEAGSERTPLAQAGGTVTDVDGTPYYKPGGHHEMPNGVFGKWDLSPDTRKVFRDASTGRVPQMILRTTPDGVPQGHFWNGPNGARHQYNTAVQELADRFLEKNSIRPENMTPDQARDLLREIRESQDQRIRNYNSTIRLLRRLFPVRTGRGNE